MICLVISEPISQSIRNNMDAENNPEATSSNQPTTEDTPAVQQEDSTKTNGEATTETLDMPSPAKAR